MLLLLNRTTPHTINQQSHHHSISHHTNVSIHHWFGKWNSWLLVDFCFLLHSSPRTSLRSVRPHETRRQEELSMLLFVKQLIKTKKEKTNECRYCSHIPKSSTLSTWWRDGTSSSDSNTQQKQNISTVCQSCCRTKTIDELFVWEIFLRPLAKSSWSKQVEPPLKLQERVVLFWVEKRPTKRQKLLNNNSNVVNNTATTCNQKAKILRGFHISISICDTTCRSESKWHTLLSLQLFTYLPGF